MLSVYFWSEKFWCAKYDCSFLSDDVVSIEQPDILQSHWVACFKLTVSSNKTIEHFRVGAEKVFSIVAEVQVTCDVIECIWNFDRV